MLDEEENAGTQELLRGDGENERQRQKRGTSRSQGRHKAALEYDQENNNNDDQNHKQQDLIKHRQGLTDVLHAVRDGLSLLANVDNLADHLVETDIAVLVSVDGIEALLGFFAVMLAQHFNDVVQQQGLLAFGGKRHPDTASHGLGAADLFESLDDDGMSGRRVEDVLASDLGSNVAENGGDLVADAADVTDDAHGGAGSVAHLLAPVAHDEGVDTIVDDVVFVGKLWAVHGEQGPGSFVEET